MSDDTSEPRKRKTVVELIQNGVGQMITRLLIMGMPFACGYGLWSVNKIVELKTNEVLSALERMDKRMAEFSGILKETRSQVGGNTTQLAAQGATIEGLKERVNERGRK